MSTEARRTIDVTVTAPHKETQALRLLVRQAVFEVVIDNFLLYGDNDKTFARRVANLDKLFAETAEPPGGHARVRDLVARFLADSESVDDADHVHIINVAVANVMHVLTPAWIVSLTQATVAEGGFIRLRTDILDEAFLPRGNAQAQQAFEDHIRNSGVDSFVPEEGRLMLEKLQAVMPAGEKFPKQMRDFLEAVGVVVI